MLTVLIVDDHAPFRASARALLELDGFVVVGEAHDSASALALARALEPDLVVVDVGLPDASGFDVAERLEPTSAGVVLTSSRDAYDVARLARCGALGFVAKEHLSGAVLRALLEGRS